MRFTVQVEIMLLNAHGTKDLNAVAMHCSRALPWTLGQLLEAKMQESYEGYGADLIDYSCKLTATLDQEDAGQALLTLTTTMSVYERAEEVDEDELSNDDSDEEVDEDEGTLKAIAMTLGRHMAEQGKVTDGTQVEIADKGINVNVTTLAP